MPLSGFPDFSVCAFREKNEKNEEKFLTLSAFWLLNAMYQWPGQTAGDELSLGRDGKPD